MRKEFIRKQTIKVRKTCKSYAKIQRFLKRKYNVNISRRTLKRWWKKYQSGWNLKDQSRKPKTTHYKFEQEEIQKVIDLRNKTGYSSYQLKIKLEEKGVFMSESTIKNIIKTCGLSRGNKIEGKRFKWVRFERKHPDSMWQLDGTQLDDGTWILLIEDDCSRYCLAIRLFEHMTTKNVIEALEQCIKMHGKPREILTDNGSEFGGNGENENEFDKWCQKQGIIHIRSGVHKPTIVGKISRIQFTIQYELPYCFNDYEYFRYRYNHERPHRSLDGKTPAEVYFAFHKLF